MVGLYETAVDAICGQKGVYPKVIASTATIRRAKEQCSVLYNREVVQFPAPGLDAEDSFFAKESVIEGLDAGRRHFVGLHSHSVSDTLAWETAQAYIALGFILFASAGMGIDSTALEGADFDKLDEILGLRKRGLRSVVAVSLGYRSEDDSNAKRPKSRLSKEDLFEEI